MNDRYANIKAALFELEKEEDLKNQAQLQEEFPDWEVKYNHFKQKHSAKQYIKPWKFKWGIVAAVFVGCIIMSVPVYGTVRQAVEMIFTRNEFFTTINYDVQSDKEVPEYIENKYIPQYVPEGFIVEKMYFYDDEKVKVCAISYINEQGGSIYFDQSTLDGANRKHDEGASVTQIEIKGYEAYLYTNLKNNALFWTDDEYAYSINFSGVSEEEIIKMAESIKE